MDELEPPRIAVQVARIVFTLTMLVAMVLLGVGGYYTGPRYYYGFGIVGALFAILLVLYLLGVLR